MNQPTASEPSFESLVDRRQRARWGSWAVLVLLWWLCRAILQSRLHFGLDDFTLALGAGYAQDLLWVTCLWASSGPRVFISGFAALMFTARLLDLWAVTWTGVHVGPLFWFHVDARLWRVAIEQGAPLVIGVGVGFIAMAWRLMMRAPHHGLPRWICPVVVVTIAAHTWLSPVHDADLYHLPEIIVFRSWVEHEQAAKAEAYTPSVSMQQRWRDYGWLPTPKEAVAQPDSTPLDGLVVVFMESSSASLSRVYDRAAPLDTPGLRGLAATGLTLDGYRAQAAPTHAGLLTSLCGMLPSAWPLTSARHAQLPRLPTCLPAAVVKAGGSAHLLMGSPLQFTGLDRLAEGMGFSRAEGLKEFSNGDDNSAGPWGLFDERLYEFALKRLRQLTARRKPFLVVVSTTDGHLPGTIAPTCGQTPGKSQFLSAQACADRALGRFIAAVKADPRLQKVALVATADHAAPRVGEAAEALPGGAHFAKLPLVIDDRRQQRRRKTIDGGQVDLAATLAPLLGLRFSRGRNLLNRDSGGERVTLARSDNAIVGIEQAGRWVEAPLSALRRRCASGPVTQRLQCDAAAYLKALDSWWFGDRLVEFFPD